MFCIDTLQNLPVASNTDHVFQHEKDEYIIVLLAVHQRKKLMGLAEETSWIEATCETSKEKKKRRMSLSRI